MATFDDLLRLGAENSRLKARVAELERERDDRLTDRQVQEFGDRVACATAVWYRDQETMSPFAKVLRPPLDLLSVLSDYRRFRA